MLGGIITESDKRNLKEIVDTFEELKKNVYIIDRGSLGRIIVKFKDENFFHLLGLHKMNLDIYFPQNLKSKSKKYQYIKSRIDKFDHVICDQTKEKSLLQFRISTFKNITNLLIGQNTSLYEFREKVPGSQFNGDYGVLKIYEDVNCLLGLRKDCSLNDNINCVPISWMASNRANKLVELKRPVYMNTIYSVPIELYNDEFIYK